MLDSEMGEDLELTLGENQRVVLDEVGKGGLGQLVDIGISGGGQASNSCHEAAGNALRMHYESQSTDDLE